MKYVLAALLLTLSSTAYAQPLFEDRGGYVVMEMESVPLDAASEWVEQSELADARGSYYTFNGNGICNGPANSPIRYPFRVNAGDVYELRLRGAKRHHCVLGQPHGDKNRCEEDDRTCDSLSFPSGDTCGGADQCIRTDISNDAFVYIEDASGGYVEFVGQPGGSVGDPIKLFGGGNDAWGWTGKRALDTGGSKYDARWDLPAGEYTLVIQGRSQQFRIDRMVLFDDQGSTRGADALDETLVEPVATEDAGSGGADAGEDAGAGGMDAGVADAGAGSDAGGGGADAGGPGADVGSSGDAGSSGGADAGGTAGQPVATPSARDEGCAAAGGSSRPVGAGLLGLLLAGLAAGFRRRE